jgi:hypothetical protein
MRAIENYGTITLMNIDTKILSKYSKFSSALKNRS